MSVPPSASKRSADGDSASAAPAYEMACLACSGIPAYRVRVTHPNGLSGDNFDQLVDHRPRLFATDMYLEIKATSGPGAGSVTVWRLGGQVTDPMKLRIADATVIAYAGPDPSTGGRTWWSETSPQGR